MTHAHVHAHIALGECPSAAFFEPHPGSVDRGRWDSQPCRFASRLLWGRVAVPRTGNEIDVCASTVKTSVRLIHPVL